MFSRYQQRFLAVVTLVLLIGSLATARSRRVQHLQAGSWGGPNIRMNVGSGSATVDYACANGTINGPLTIDRKGHFNWHGSHNQEHGGPMRIDEASNGRPAIYSGWIKGDTMTLTVKLADTNDVVDSFTLKRGGSGRVFKCK